MKEIKNKPIKDLMKLIHEKQESLKDFRFGSAGAKVKNVKEGRNLRKDIARIMTEITSQFHDSNLAAAEKEIAEILAVTEATAKSRATEEAKTK